MVSASINSDAAFPCIEPRQFRRVAGEIVMLQMHASYINLYIKNPMVKLD